jgi:hyaluronoglucosaminidase
MPLTAAANTPTTLPAVYPVPRQMALRTGRIPIGRQVTLVATAASDAAAVAETRRVLTASGAATIRVAQSSASPAAKGLTVYVGANAAAERSLHVSGAKALPAGGYVLAAGVAAGRPVIVLDGVDTAGQFYASQTLRQLLVGRRDLPSIAIRDWPSFPLRGVVEGFYATPWSTKTRLSALDFLGAHKLNLYIYTPKRDPLLRATWWKPYSRDALRTIGKLVDRANQNHVTFNFGISPGLSICYSSPTDEAKLTQKLKSVWNIGVRSFTVAFDDIDPQRPACDSDRQRFGTGDSALASAQAYLLNRVDDFVARLPGSMPLIAVPTDYKGIDETPFKRTLAAALHADVVVQWTGRYGVSVTISGREAATARQLYAHPLLVWDNYFANDYIPNLVLGAYEGRDSRLTDSAMGVTVVPMGEPEASKIGLFTVADYAWNAAAYDSARSWEASLREFSRGDAKTLAALRWFAGANYSTPLDPLPAPILSKATATFWTQWAAGDPSAVPTLAQVLRSVRDSTSILRDRLWDLPFITEASPWLDGTNLWARAAIAALDALDARRKQLPDQATADEQAARTLRIQAESVMWPGKTPAIPVQVSGRVLADFVHYGLRGYGPG